MPRELPICSTCNGSGEGHTEWSTCIQCRGTGQVITQEDIPYVPSDDCKEDVFDYYPEDNDEVSNVSFPDYSDT